MPIQSLLAGSRDLAGDGDFCHAGMKRTVKALKCCFLDIYSQLLFKGMGSFKTEIPVKCKGVGISLSIFSSILCLKICYGGHFGVLRVNVFKHQRVACLLSMPLNSDG